MLLSRLRTPCAPSAATRNLNGLESLTPRCRVAARFRAWAPAAETIDEADRRKRIQITSRFDDADKDKNGRIDLQELRSLLEAACSDTVQPALLKHWLTDAEVARLMAMYDKDNSGDLTAEEFACLVNDGLLLDEKLADYQAAFAAADADGSGDISADELAVVLQRLGWPRASDTDALLALMKRYGVNERGRIDFTSFMALLKDNMMDVREVLSYVGARPESPTTTANVIHAVACRGFHLITSAEELESHLASAGERLVLLMAGTTWCRSSRAIVDDVKALAAAYPSVVVLMLWGNVNAATKTLFRDQLKVRSTPAFFVYSSGELVCHWAGSDRRQLETELRRRLPPGAEAPAAPLFGGAAAAAAAAAE